MSRVFCSFLRRWKNQVIKNNWNILFVYKVWENTISCNTKLPVSVMNAFQMEILCWNLNWCKLYKLCVFGGMSKRFHFFCIDWRYEQAYEQPGMSWLDCWLFVPWLGPQRNKQRFSNEVSCQYMGTKSETLGTFF